MAVAYDTASTASGNGVTSITWSHTCTGSDLALGVGASHNGTITGVTYNSVAMTDCGSSTGTYHVSIWKLSAPASGANNVVITFSASSAASCGAMSMTGAHQTTGSLTGTFASANGTSTTPSVSVSSATGELVFAVTASNTTFTPVTPGTGQTEAWDIEPIYISSWASYEAGATSVTMDGTATGFETWAIGGISFVAAAGGGASATNTGWYSSKGGWN